ncbi:hypothetical protein GCM10010116_10090 [Microbispora rosea subsp. aerata]|nr:hypothetical protein GCM10010116_10090 [Microbispora rosea subsp. aerata]GIH56213.1 hypothetical protein Mro02_31270 [Microbispora rosea subsp. aerata]GLJ82347.1 hypothetical protein GCM10017588_10720 [Microbispora rosea subsp. aerata]
MPRVKGVPNVPRVCEGADHAWTEEREGAERPSVTREGGVCGAPEPPRRRRGKRSAAGVGHAWTEEREGAERLSVTREGGVCGAPEPPRRRRGEVNKLIWSRVVALSN